MYQPGPARSRDPPIAGVAVCGAGPEDEPRPPVRTRGARRGLAGRLPKENPMNRWILAGMAALLVLCAFPATLEAG